MASDAVGNERISRVVGYKLTKGNFALTSPNLPQRIAILGEANNQNQASLSLTPKEITSAQQAGQLYGFGSPIYHMTRILRPINGDGVGGIPVIVYPQAEAPGAVAKVFRINPSGVATGSGVHKLRIAGRDGIDGLFYDINIVAGDTAATIAQKIANAINAVLGAPVLAFYSGYNVICTTKWKGLTANEVNASIDVGDNAFGLTYAVQTVVAGSGTPSVQEALDQFGASWNTIVVNSYGLEATTMTLLETFNGIPNPTTPTGRYAALVTKPFIAISGSISDDVSATTDLRLDNVTIAVAPAPGSLGFSFEAAANMTYLFAIQAQQSPNLDVAGQSYPDMPTPTSIGSMATYTNRDAFVKKGLSTVDLVAGKYQVQDFVTTYHPVGEIVPQYRYCRNLNIDWNVRYGYYLLEQTYVVDHSIARDDDFVSADKVIKPKQWKGVLDAYADDLSARALTVDADFMQASITVNISSTNPDRLETFFKYKRSGFTRISSTTAEAGFNFGG